MQIDDPIQNPETYIHDEAHFISTVSNVLVTKMRKSKFSCRNSFVCRYDFAALSMVFAGAFGWRNSWNTWHRHIWHLTSECRSSGWTARNPYWNQTCRQWMEIGCDDCVCVFVTDALLGIIKCAIFDCNRIELAAGTSWMYVCPIIREIMSRIWQRVNAQSLSFRKWKIAFWCWIL